MFLFVGREDKDIVKVNYIEYVNVALKHTVNIYLEEGRGIGQTKGHNKIFVVPVIGTESRFPLVSFAYSNPMVGVP